MGLLPPMPSWDGLHPVIIHFPIALLLVAPLLVIVSLFVKSARPWAAAGLVVMTLGTLATYLSVSTGEAAGELAERSALAARAVLEQHEEMAETTRNLFTALTLMFGALVVLPALTRRPLARTVSMSATVIFLALYAGGALVLMNTAHQGGRLVHEYGVRAAIAPTPAGTDMTAHGAGHATNEAHERGERD